MDEYDSVVAKLKALQGEIEQIAEKVKAARVPLTYWHIEYARYDNGWDGERGERQKQTVIANSQADALRILARLVEVYGMEITDITLHDTKDLYYR